MGSLLKDYADNVRIEDTAHHVMRCFEEVLGRKLNKDEQKFTLKITKSTFDKYVIADRGDILVVGEDEKKKLDSLLEDMVTNISALIVHYIYSRLEAYILFNRLKDLKEK
jgi:hypothetical protein